MFNSYSSNQQIQINAVSGVLTKNYKESFFETFAIGSPLANRVFCPEASITFDYEQKKVVVLQVMLCGDNRVIVELMYKKDFDRLFSEVE